MMITTELLNTLRQLDRAEKLRVIQVLALEMAEEEDHLIEAGQGYPVWSPYDANEAADVMLRMLKGAKTQNHAER